MSVCAETIQLLVAGPSTAQTFRHFSMAKGLYRSKVSSLMQLNRDVFADRYHGRIPFKSCRPSPIQSSAYSRDTAATDGGIASTGMQDAIARYPLGATIYAFQFAASLTGESQHHIPQENIALFAPTKHDIF
jgi:hypothetical protein